MHLLLAISVVGLCSLKNATALLRMISPFTAIYFFLEMAVCLLGAGSEDLRIWTCASNNCTKQPLSVWI